MWPKMEVDYDTSVLDGEKYSSKITCIIIYQLIFVEADTF